MSEPVTALKNARYDAGIATISEVAPLGMITIRGDLDAPYVRKVTKKLTGVDRPEHGQCQFEGAAGVAWMSPDELLLFCPHSQVPEVLARLPQKTAARRASPRRSPDRAACCNDALADAQSRGHCRHWRC